MRGTQRHKIAILQRSKVLPIVTWSFVSRWTPYGITEWHCRNRHGLYQKASRLQTKVRYSTNHLVQNLAKKNFFFKLILLIFLHRLSNGGESLFQASDDDEMSQWVNAINTVADPGTGAGAGRAQTLPAGERRPGDEPKKRSFFTLKKK